jgi:hypothetical protein
MRSEAMAVCPSSLSTFHSLGVFRGVGGKRLFWDGIAEGGMKNKWHLIRKKFDFYLLLRR